MKKLNFCKFIYRQRTWIIKAAIGGMIGVVILIGIIAITVTLTGKIVVELVFYA